MPVRPRGGTALDTATVLVTGASSGIGLAVAERCAAEGARLLLTGRDESRLQDAAHRLGGHRTRWHAADLRSPADLEVLADWATLRGPPDVVVHSAGVGLAGDTGSTPLERQAQVLSTNLAAPVALTERLGAGMVRAGGGHVVFLTSVAGLLGAPREAVYSASKAGLEGYARSLRLELSAAGVRVTTIATGPVDTAFFDRRGEPYGRRFPRPLPVDRVAAAVVAAVKEDVEEVVLPRWLRGPVLLAAVAPRTYGRLARRWA